MCVHHIKIKQKRVSMKLLKKAALASVAALMCTTAAEATPAFARQMQSDCMTCHYQAIPRLNSFGRDFKLSGFTMTGGVAEITSDSRGGVAIPSTLNMAFVTKARLLKEGTTPMKTEIFDENAFIFGGKVANGVGVSLEFDGSDFGGKFAFVKDIDAGRLGFVYANTSGLGAFAGAETLSTGLYRPVRQFELRKQANIFQKLGIGAGEATGFQAYYNGNGLFVTVGQYAPAFANSATTGISSYKTMARAIYEMDVSGLNVAMGGYYIGGDASFTMTQNGLAVNDAATRESTGIDLQIEGDMAAMPIMLTAGVVLSNTYGVSSDQTGASVALSVF